MVFGEVGAQTRGIGRSSPGGWATELAGPLSLPSRPSSELTDTKMAGATSAVPAPSAGSRSASDSFRITCTRRGAEHTKLVAIGIGHDHPIDIALADVDPSRPKGDQMGYLRSLITVVGRSDVEMKPVLPDSSGQSADHPR